MCMSICVYNTVSVYVYLFVQDCKCVCISVCSGGQKASVGTDGDGDASLRQASLQQPSLRQLVTAAPQPPGRPWQQLLKHDGQVTTFTLNDYNDNDWFYIVPFHSLC